MSHADKTMVNLKAGVSFAWLDKELNIKLKQIVGERSRTHFIKQSAREQFGVELETTLDLTKFDHVIRSYHYQNRAEWLREICRNKINEYERKK
jgi:hypothetical protein